jgi:uncharacterized membrane protein YhhN
MNPTLLILFLAVALVHLYACLKEKNKLRAITKPMLMPLLAMLYLVSTNEPHSIVVAALLFGAAGDVFLLFPKKPARFMMGGLSFGMGHILYIAAFFLYAGAAKLPIYSIALILAFFIAAAAIGFIRLKPAVPKKFNAPVLFYMLVLCTMGAVATMSFFAKPSTGRALFPLGAILFLLSDALLANLLFVRENQGKNFSVMATYLAAQTLITAGFIIL